MTKHFLLFGLAILFASTLVFSQADERLKFTDEELRTEFHWVELMQQKNPNFYEVKRAYDLYFETHEKVKGSGWKQFERWAWLVEGDVRPDGSLPKPDAVYNAYYEYKRDQPQRGPSSNAGTWTEIGPMSYPVNSTSQETGTGRVNGLAFHPIDPNKFWVGAPSGGLWSTTDGGQTYSSNTDQMPTLGVSSILVNPGTPNIMYLGSGDRDAGNAPGLGVFKSTDSGTTWNLSNTGMGSVTVGMMEFYPGTSSTIIAATSGGIFRSTDSGTNWILVSSNTANYKDIKIHPTDPNYMYATASGNFYKSTDAGLNWAQITTGLVSCGRMVLGVSADEPDAVFCLLTGGSQIFQGIFKSTDKGLNFSRITSAAHPNILGYNDGDGNSQATYDLCMLVNPNDADMILVGSVCIHRSDDGGLTFSKKAHWSTQVHADQHTVAINPLNGRIYEGHDGGLHYSDDYFETWTNISAGLNIAQAYKIGQAAQTKNLVVNGYQDNGTGIFDAGTFTTITGGDGMECLIDYDDESYVYATYISNIKRSTSGGYGNWASIAKDGQHGIDESGAWITPYMLHESDPNTMFFGYKNIWRSNNVRNNPPTWTKISNNLGGSNLSNYRALAQSSADNNIFYGVRSDNNFFRSDNVNDASPTWTDLTNNLPSGSGHIDDVTCHPTDPEIVYLIQSDKVFKSIDKGNSWTDISGTIPASGVNCFIYDKFSDEGIYVGTRTGVFFKNAGMADWILFDGSLPVVDVRELEIYYGSTDSRLRAGTYGRGLWETPLYHDPALPPIANFKANKTAVNIGATVSFEDLTENSPTSWVWTITPVSFTYENGTSANSQHPEVNFTSSGVYTISLLASNANGSDTKTINSYISVYNIVSPDCTPTTQNFGGFGMGIYHVQLNTIDKSSGQPYQDNNVTGYMDFINTDNTVLSAGTSYDLTVELGTGYDEYWNVYIDYNNDGDFTDLGEEVYVAPSKVTGVQIITIDIPASPGVLDQLLRMRILCDFGSISGPCYDPTYGQAEDYGLVIKDLPILSTTVVSNIGSDDAQSGGNISDQGSSSVSSRGVVWGFYSNPTIDNNIGNTENGTGTGSFVSQLQELEVNQLYYIRAYAINSSGISYGQNESFTTLSETPVLSTDDISNISYYTATGGGNITSDGGQPITSRGLVWDTVSGPTFGNNVGSTNDGTGSGTFTSSITGLFPDKTYYVKAYASNSYSTAYGSEKTFTTLGPDANQSRDILFDNVTIDKMDVMWTNGSGSKRIVKINTVSSFTPPVDGTDPTANTIFGGSEQVIYNGAGSMLTVTNLDPSTTYYFIVYDYTGTGSSTVFNAAAGISNPYYCSTFCLPDYTTGNVGTYIKRFVLNTIDNSSSNAHYSDFSHISTDILPGTTYDVSFGMSYNQERLGLWIDLNDNQEFEASEKLLSEFICPANVVTTTQITIPSSANSGNHLLRVRASWNSGAGPCSTSGQGEVEDYSVNIIGSWTGATSTDWATTTNWSQGSVPIATENVIIPTTPMGSRFPLIGAGTNATCNDLEINASANLSIRGSLTVNGTLSNTPGTSGITIKSDASGSGSLIQSTASVSATIERYMEAYSGDGDGWHFLSSPIETFNISGSAFVPGGSDDLYAWSESEGLWKNYKAGDPSQIVMGQGYLIARASTVTKNFSGVLNNANKTWPNLSNTPANDHAGWHLLGNPYASAISWGTGSWNMTNIGAIAKIYKEATGAYIDISGGAAIPATQGFMAYVSSGTNSLTIPLSERTHSSQNWYKDEELNKIMLTVYDTENNTAQESVIRLNENSTEDFDIDYDSYFFAGFAPQFYSIINDGKLSTNALPEINWDTKIPFSFIKNEGSNYYVLAEGIIPVESEENIYLTDNKLNKSQDLKENPRYDFTAEDGDIEERFILHFSPLEPGNSQTTEHINVFSSKGNIEIRSTRPLSGEVYIYNISGQIIGSAELKDQISSTILLANIKGAVLVKIIDQEKTSTYKVIVI